MILVDILAANKIDTTEQLLQPNRGNKISKKNKKKTKNQDWEDESEGTKKNIYFFSLVFVILIPIKSGQLLIFLELHIKF